MQARIITARVAAGRLDEFTRRWRDLMAPVQAREPSARGATLLVEPRTGEAVIISLWEAPAGCTADERGRISHEVEARLADLITSELTEDQFEVGARV